MELDSSKVLKLVEGCEEGSRLGGSDGLKKLCLICGERDESGMPLPEPGTLLPDKPRGCKRRAER